jgi:hypothetical protein
VGQIAGPQFFKSSQAPAYRSGIVAMLCGFIINLVLNQVLRFLYVRENARRDKLIAGKSEEELLQMKNESELQGFEDVTDKENVSVFTLTGLPSIGALLTCCPQAMFRYVL